MNIEINLLNNGKLPQKQTQGSVGYDLFAAEDCVIGPNEVKLIKLGFIIALPTGIEAQIRSRSGLALKKQLFVLNSPGTIDFDYRQEVCCILMNLSKEEVHINLHDRIAQLVFARVEFAEFKCVQDVADYDENGLNRFGGFGSTGI